MSGTKPKKNVSSSISTFKSVAAQLLLRGRGGSEAANGDSIEFFSDLRKCQPEPRLSGQTERREPGWPEDGRGTTRRRGSRAGSDELLCSEFGKHDYDWLLTPPATPLGSPTTSSSINRVSTLVSNQLARAGSASNVGSNSGFGRTTGQQNETATSRLARSSSVAQSSSLNTPANASSGGHLSHVRTMSSASLSSSNTARSNASVSSTPLGSTASSPRTPVAARSASSTARPCRGDKAHGKQQTYGPVGGARQPRASSSTKPRTGHPAPTPSGVLSQRSTRTASTPQQVPPTPSKRANAVARSRLAGTGSTAHTPSSLTTSRNRDVHQPTGALLAAASTTTSRQRWRQSLAPAVAAARSARREDSVANNASPRYSAVAPKISADKAKATTQRTTVGSGFPRTGSRLMSANSNELTKTGQTHDAKNRDGAPAHRKPALQPWSSRSVSSMSRLGRTHTTSEVSACSISMGQSTPENGRRVTARAVAAARIVSGPDAFPSTRYDAMLLREDPKNLTWLRGCDEGDEGLELLEYCNRSGYLL